MSHLPFLLCFSHIEFYVFTFSQVIIIWNIYCSFLWIYIQYMNHTNASFWQEQFSALWWDFSFELYKTLQIQLYIRFSKIVVQHSYCILWHMSSHPLFSTTPTKMKISPHLEFVGFVPLEFSLKIYKTNMRVYLWRF